MPKAEQFVYLDPFKSFSLRQDHNSSLACQFLHATARPDTRIFLHSPSLCIPNVFQPLLPFPLICLFSFFPFHSQQTFFFFPPTYLSSTPLILSVAIHAVISSDFVFLLRLSPFCHLFQTDPQTNTAPLSIYTHTHSDCFITLLLFSFDPIRES